MTWHQHYTCVCFWSQTKHYWLNINLTFLFSFLSRLIYVTIWYLNTFLRVRYPTDRQTKKVDLWLILCFNLTNWASHLCVRTFIGGPPPTCAHGEWSSDEKPFHEERYLWPNPINPTKINPTFLSIICLNFAFKCKQNEPSSLNQNLDVRGWI